MFALNAILGHTIVVVVEAAIGSLRHIPHTNYVANYFFATYCFPPEFFLFVFNFKKKRVFLPESFTTGPGIGRIKMPLGMDDLGPIAYCCIRMTLKGQGKGHSIKFKVKFIKKIRMVRKVIGKILEM